VDGEFTAVPARYTFTSRKAVHLPQESVDTVKMQTSVVVDIQTDESWAEIT
jgi:DEAD/DEAH box helicase domain-containing protein